MTTRAMGRTAACLLAILIPSLETPAAAAEIPKNKEHINSIGMKFVRIEPGTFQMGSIEVQYDERPVRQVTISSSFYMAVTEPAFGFMHVTGDVASMARDYLDVILLGLPVMLLFWVVSAIFQGAGDTRTPFWILGGSFLLNAVLDPLLIFGWGPIPALGLKGAALATVGSQAVGAVPGLVLLARRGLISVRRPLLSAGSLSKPSTSVRIRSRWTFPP